MHESAPLFRASIVAIREPAAPSHAVIDALNWSGRQPTPVDDEGGSLAVDEAVALGTTEEGATEALVDGET